MYLNPKFQTQDLFGVRLAARLSFGALAAGAAWWLGIFGRGGAALGVGGKLVGVNQKHNRLST